MTQKKVLVLCLNDPSGDPRPRRIIDLCNSLGCSVSIVSYEPKKEKIQYDDFFPLKKMSSGRISSLLRYAFLAYVVVVQKLISNNKIRDRINDKRFFIDEIEEHLKDKVYDLYIVEDLQFLPLIFRINRDKPVIFDVREYYPKQRENSVLFRLFEKPERVRLCKRYLKKCDYLLTVSNGLAAEYKREFDVDMIVNRSVPNRRQIPVHLKSEGTVRIVHHGVANYGRKLENLIWVMKKLDSRFTLDFYLTGSEEYMNKLKQIAGQDERIRFNAPVSFSELIPTLSKYDIGFFYVEPTTFNLKHCLPNKFFEYIQARLMIAIGPSPDMAELVEKYSCGVVADSFSIDAMALKLSELTQHDINVMKKNSNIAAEELCYEEENKQIVGLFEKLGLTDFHSVTPALN